MMLQIPQLFSVDEVKEIRKQLETAEWMDGKATAGQQAKASKNNLQLAPGELADKIASMVMTRAKANPLFFAAVLPLKMHPPRVNRYEGGGNYGFHVDNAFQSGSGGLVRTDVSSTLFLSDPDEYEGGELVIEDTYGTHRVKLAAGSLVVYPGTSLHQVTPVMRGTRLATFFWSQSMVRDDTQRRLLVELDGSIQRLTNDVPNHPDLLRLTGLYHNLLRQWADS